MCCIFTWLSWCFDATHRLVVFFMACMISSSVCCLLLTASLAGVAMGYNYSLAEYMDLKETNISVYIKRGVYDDEIADDFDWRRKGGGEPSLVHKDTGLRTGGSDTENSQASGRRSQSAFESDDEHKYEGSLMRLTATPTVMPFRRFQPDPPYTASSTTTKTIVDELLAVADNLPGGSMDRLKAIQAAAKHHEARKIELATAQIPEDASERQKAILENAQIHDARRNDPLTTTDKYAKYFNQLAGHPGFPGSGLSARKFMESQQKDMGTIPPNRFRDAVFRGQLAGWPTGASPKPTTENFFEYEMNVAPSGMPTPPTVKPLLVRPGDNQPIRGLWEITTEIPRPILRTRPRETKEEILYDSPKSPSKSKTEDSPKKGRNDNDYEESHGLPIRKKRSNDQVSGGHKLYDGDPIARTNIRINGHNPEPVNNYSVLIRKIDDKYKSQNNTQSTNISQPTELQTRNSTENVTNKIIRNITSLNDTLNVNNEISSVDQFIMKSAEHATSSDTKQEKMASKPRKRKKISEGYDNRTHENMQTKPIWWKISVGAQEQWHRIVNYLNKVINRNPKSKAKTDKNYAAMADSNQSTLIYKLRPTITNKRVDEDTIDTNNTNIPTNRLETSTGNIPEKMTPPTFITKIIQSTSV